MAHFVLYQANSKLKTYLYRGGCSLPSRLRGKFVPLSRSLGTEGRAMRLAINRIVSLLGGPNQWSLPPGEAMRTTWLPDSRDWMNRSDVYSKEERLKLLVSPHPRHFLPAQLLSDKFFIKISEDCSKYEIIRNPKVIDKWRS